MPLEIWSHFLKNDVLVYTISIISFEIIGVKVGVFLQNNVDENSNGCGALSVTKVFHIISI